MRPLYLDARRGAAVALDGPALAVRGIERAIGRYPLRLVSRVVVCGTIQWDTRALLECLRRGIPVCFAEPDGELLGVCVGMRADAVPLHERLAELALRPDWPEHYATWLVAAERRAVLAALRALRLDTCDLRAPVARAAIGRRLSRICAEPAARRVCGFLESAAMAFAARVLEESGVSPSLLIDDREGHNLVRDLGRLLGWDVRVLACRLLGRAGAAPERRALALAYQEREDRQWKLAHDYLALLERRAIALAFGDE